MRRVLPPHYELRTRPDNLNEFALPLELELSAVNEWALNNIETHRQRITTETDPSSVQRSFDAFVARFDDAFVHDVTNVLIWFSGKDILAGMSEWLNTRAFANPGAFRASLRDWIIANPERTLELLTEWNTLIKVFKA